MRFLTQLTLGMALVLCLVMTAQAQPGGGRGGFGGGFGGGGKLRLLQIEAVQKELGLTEDQIASIRKLQEELRPARPGGRGEGRPGGEGGERRRRRGGDGAPEARSGVPAQWYFVQDEQPRRGQFSEEDRARFREQAEQRTKKENEELGKILKPEQLKRLRGIYIQITGVAALNDADIASELGITDDQKQKLQKVREEQAASMRELFQGGDREAIREKMAEARKTNEEKTLAVLTDEQKKKWEDMKGAKFELPEGVLRGGPGGRGNRPQNRETN